MTLKQIEIFTEKMREQGFSEEEIKTYELLMLNVQDSEENFEQDNEEFEVVSLEEIDEEF